MLVMNQNDDPAVKTLAEAKILLLKNREANRQHVKLFVEKIKNTQKMNTDGTLQRF